MKHAASRSRATVPIALAMALLGAVARGEDGLRVGTSGDYAPFSYVAPEAPDGLDGFDLAVARLFAADRGLDLELVRFTWPKLRADLASGRFDVAMSGITVNPERSVAGRFTAPVATSGAVALVAEDSPFQRLEDLRVGGVRLGVNAGGHLERASRRAFPRSTLVAIPDNDAVLPALLDGGVDAAITDDLEAPHWQRRAPGLRLLGPFTRDLKAYLVRSERPELARDLDAWLFTREADGTLGELREKYLGRDDWAETTLLRALLAAMDERLDLMPLVAQAKRAAGLAVRDPEREARVIDEAVATATGAAERAGLLPLPERWVRRLFRAQIDAAVAVQQAALARDPTGEPTPDLEAELRPALLRLGERIAGYLAQLPGPLDPDQLDRMVAEGLSAPGLEARHQVLIADTLAQISRYRAP